MQPIEPADLVNLLDGFESLEEQRYVKETFLEHPSPCQFVDSNQDNLLLKYLADAQTHSLDVLRQILLQDTDLGHQNSAGKTALEVAIGRAEPQVVQLLVDASENAPCSG